MVSSIAAIGVDNIAQVLDPLVVEYNVIQVVPSVGLKYVPIG